MAGHAMTGLTEERKAEAAKVAKETAALRAVVPIHPALAAQAKAEAEAKAPAVN